MKKLLSLIGTISIIGSGVSTVVACGDNNSSSKPGAKVEPLESTIIPSQLTPDQKQADAIKRKIVNVDLIVPAGTNPDTKNTATITAIKKALQKDNPALTSDDLTTITFAKATLKTKIAVPMQASITVGVATDTVGLKVTLLESDHQKVADIVRKITKFNLTVPAGTNPDTTNVATIKAMKKVLQKANPQLTPSDMAKITFSKATLVAQWPIAVFAIITVGAVKDTVGLKIKLL